MGAGGGSTEPTLGPQDSETTYFCNTCGQPLCARCRDETHRARMFASHEIVALGQRSRDVLPKCSECGVATGPGRGRDRAGRCPGPNRRPSAALHAEAYIMFSTDKKSLLCIRCFRDMQGWVRGAGGQRGSRCGAEPGSPAGVPQGEPGPLRGPRVSLCAGLRAAGAGGAGERGVPCTPRQGQGWGCTRAQEADAASSPGCEGPADRHTGGHRAAAGHGGGGAPQRCGGGGGHPRPIRQHAGAWCADGTAIG